MPRSEKGFLLLAALFWAALIICNIITFKLGILWNVEWLNALGIGFMVQTVGILPYPLTFLVTDLISEVYGKTRANWVVFCGLIVSLFVLAVIMIGREVTPLPKNAWNADWHLKRIALKLELSEAEHSALKEFTPALNALAGLRGRERSTESTRLEEEFLQLLSAPNRSAYLDLKRQRLHWSAAYFSARELADEPDRHLGQDWMADAFIEFFLYFPGELSADERTAAHAGLQPVQPFIDTQSSYEQVFGQTFRAILASMIAYLVAQLIDVRLFHFWRRLTRGRFLWLRNNASTFTSQVVDTFLVIFILFYGVYETDDLLKWVYAGVLFKWMWALLDTPFLYLGVYLFKRFVPEAVQHEDYELPAQG